MYLYRDLLLLFIFTRYVLYASDVITTIVNYARNYQMPVWNIERILTAKFFGKFMHEKISNVTTVKCAVWIMLQV